MDGIIVTDTEQVLDFIRERIVLLEAVEREEILEELEKRLTAGWSFQGRNTQ